MPENGCGDISMKTKVLIPFRLVNPEMFATFVMVSFQKSPTNISNDMTKNLILAAAMPVSYTHLTLPTKLEV